MTDVRAYKNHDIQLLARPSHNNEPTAAATSMHNPSPLVFLVPLCLLIALLHF